MIIGAEVEFKFLPKSRLIELLEQLPDNTVLHANAVGNLTFHKMADGEIKDYDENTRLNMLGYIDFLQEGEVCEFDDMGKLK